jgi:hypothetical protein
MWWLNVRKRERGGGERERESRERERGEGGGDVRSFTYKYCDMKQITSIDHTLSDKIHSSASYNI